MYDITKVFKLHSINWDTNEQSFDSLEINEIFVMFFPSGYEEYYSLPNKNYYVAIKLSDETCLVFIDSIYLKEITVPPGFVTSYVLNGSK